MTLTEFLAAIRLHIKDAATTWSDGEITRAITMAINDLSRFMPREQVYEVTLDYGTTTSTTWTSAAAPGTYVALTHKPIKWDSETVTDGTNACTRDTDYTMDYWNGKITHISGGEIGNADAANTITYVRDQTTLDLSSLTAMIRVTRAEYPVGNMPQHKLNFDIFDNKMIVTGFPQEQEKQQNNMMTSKHLRVYYHAQHSIPTASVAGSQPLFMDEIVIKGSEAYCWLIEAAQYEHQAVTDLASARTALGSVNHSAVNTAMAAIASELANANSALDDVGAIGGTAHGLITTALALINSTGDLGLIPFADLPDSSTPDYHALADTAMDAAATQSGLGVTPLADLPDSSTPDYHALAAAALAAASTELGKTWAASTGDLALATTAHADVEKHVGGDATNDVDMDTYMNAGDAVITTVNVGDDVAKTYLAYANMASQMANHYQKERELYIQQAQVRSGVAAGYVAEAQGKLAQVQAKIAESNGQANLSQAYIQEAQQRLNQVNAKIREGEGLANLAMAFAEEARQRIGQLDTIHGTARARIATAEGFAQEASFRLYQMDRYIAVADLYTNVAGANFTLADKYRDMGIIRRNEFWAILASRTQGRINRSSTATDN